MTNQIPVTRSSMTSFEEYVSEIKTLWDTHWLTNYGALHQQLETSLKTYLGVPEMALYTNGHLALECALAALELKGEVITTPFTFASTTHAIKRCGLQPVFCDISREDYTIDASQIEKLITKKTSAILPVHVYGAVCNVEAIERIAKNYGLKVIYDAAHAFGITKDGRGIGNFGDISMFSFHATKVFNTIEGGGLAFHHSELKEKLKTLANFGITGQETVDYISGNAKMNEFQAAMGICNLKHVEAEIAKRKLVSDRYDENLSRLPWLALLKPQPGVQRNYVYYPVIFDNAGLHRDDVFEKLKAQGIFARKYFYPLTSSFACYKGQYNPDNTPVAKDIAEKALCLPLYADLALEDVDRICAIIRES